ncbi:MAG: Uma2 family endonuclease, partial [Cyanobacteria bacterium P01_H01_bin.121]
MQVMIATPPKLETSIARFSLDAYSRMIEAGILADRNVELINGLIYEMAPEGPLHAAIVDDVPDRLKPLFLGRARVSKTRTIELPSDGQVVPDV